ncbi:MAG: hypothetical protein JW881_21085 [Spirochaetales bacterium]|nr:hypothetical protein [Spirochaetales bacterium]
MLDLDDIKQFLPKYLSPETEDKLFSDLSLFPSNIDDRMYSYIEKDREIIYQGDCLKGLLVLNLPDKEIRAATSLILSNTCDIDVFNKRKYSSNIVYSPIFKISKYKKLLLEKRIYTESSIEDHLNDLKKQKITQTFFLPKGQGLFEDSFIFFDRICCCNNEYIKRKNISDIRIVSLSQYGFWLLLYKLSIHFNRMCERVDRKY